MGRLMAGAVVVGLALGLVAPVPVGAQSAAPGSPRAASPAPADAVAVIGRALDGLRTLDAWSFEDRNTSTIWSGLETVTTGTIVNGSPWRLAMEIATEGETGWRRVVIGKDSWQNLYDGTFHRSKDLGIPVPGPDDPLPFEPLLRRLPAAGLVLTDRGRELRDGVATEHFAGQTPDWVPEPGPGASATPSAEPGTTASASPGASPSPIDPAELRAAVDLWVDAGDGHLIASDVHSVAALTVPGTSLVAEYHDDEAVTIGSVADPVAAADAIVKPSLDASAYGVTEGADPTLASAVRGAFANLAALDSYRAEVSFLGNGYTSLQRLTVQGGRRPAVELWNTFRGEPTTGVLVVGRKRWTSAADDPRWRPAKRTTALPCVAPCTVASLTDLAGTIDAIAGSFRLVSDGEDLDGTQALHLRSTAGREIAGFGVFPGTEDLWIAKDGGHLLKETFDGTAQLRSITISGVDDPANALAAPDR